MHCFDGKVERHKKEESRRRLASNGQLIFHCNKKTTRKHIAQTLIIFVASTTLASLSLLAATEIVDHQQPANATSQIMSPNNSQPAQPQLATSQQLKINSTARHSHLRRQSQVESARPPPPRIYRIRAAGANGNFATNAALRVGAPPPDEHSVADREIEGSGSGQNGTRATERLQQQQQFGARQPSRTHATKVQHQKCTQQQQATPGDGETTAEASSISASSQTLQLAPRPSGSAVASQHVVAMQRHKPTLTLGSGGEETDEPVAANERSQSLSATADANAAGLAAEAATEIERQTGDGGQQQQQTLKQVDSNNNNSNLLSLIDEFDSKITTNKTRAALSCDSGEMVIKLNFTEPFKGIVYPDHNRLSPCRFFGDGHHNYELRLPLRGCGTRQVAPRVFVNDVIVRFHKTLELEEDEVKTLICRYPPPLDITTSGGGGGAGQQVAAGNGLVHELPDNRHEQQHSQHSNRPGESALQPNQFELLEPTTSGQRPTNRFGSGGVGGSQLETNAFGELLAPPGGNQRQPIGDLINLTPAERILLRQHAKGASSVNDNLLLAPSLGGGGGANNQQRTNSRLLNPAEATSVFLDERGNLVRGFNSTTTATASANNYFDRLTSIELLFLISSLMFLVLLALGLAGSYFCLSGQRRDRNRRRRHQPALVFSSQTGGNGTGGGLLQRKRRGFSPTSVASLYQGAPVSGTGSRYQSPSGQLIAHQHPPSGHLYNPAAHRPTYYYQQYLAQAQNQPPSSPDDSDVSGQMLLPAGGGDPSAGGRSGTMTSRLASALGGSNNNSATVGGRRINYPAAAHYHASTLRPSRSHHQLYNAAGPQQQQQVVVGRRTTTGANSMGQYQTNQQHGNNTLGRRAQASFAPFREPLLKMAPPPHVSSHAPLAPPAPPHANLVAANQTLARVRHARSLQQLREEDNNNDDDEASGQRGGHFGPEHTFGADWLRHHNLTATSGDGKSVQRHCSVHARHGHLNDHKIKLKQQQHHYDTSNLTARPVRMLTQHQQTGKLGAQKTSQQVASISYDDDLGATSCSSNCSDSEEIDEKNNNIILKSERQPKLILKSIEDSFVTNFTEIYEQEYKHLDTRRPLSTAEWRDRVGGTARGAGGRSISSSSSDGEISGGEDGAATRATGTLKSSQTNLRSLTELDVNFAKSLLRPSLASATTSQQQPVGGSETPRGEEQLVRHTEPQQPPVDQQTSKPPSNNNQGEREPKANVKAETPDLVISPEYNVGQRLRLASGRQKELRPTCGSPGGESRASHDSISYV